MGNLFSSLLSSSNSLTLYSQALNIIQNNITNVNTPGYVKQTPLMSPGAVGGSMLSARSEFLEQAVRNQQQLLGSAQQKAGDLEPIQGLFDLTPDAGLPGALDRFFATFSQLSVNPNSGLSRQNVIDAAGDLSQSFQQTSAGLSRASNSAVVETKNVVDSINRIAAEVTAINQQFRSNSQFTKDPGLDAQLHTDLEELSQLTNYTVIKTSDGSYNLYLGGQTALVVGSHQFAISTDFTPPQSRILDFQGKDVTDQVTQGSLGALLEQKNVTLPKYLSRLDALAQTLADSTNTALAQGVDKNGNAPALNLFTYNAANGAAFSLGVSGITADQIAAALPGAPGGNGNAIALTQLQTQPLLNGFTLAEAYGNLGGQVGRDVAAARRDTSVQSNLVTQAQAYRASQTGVSLDEEATKLLQFQQAFQAAGKLIGILDRLSQTIMDMVH